MPELLNNSEKTIIEENSESSRTGMESKDEHMSDKGYQFTKVSWYCKLKKAILYFEVKLLADFDNKT